MTATTTPSVLFVCARNSGKSQMAAALLRQAGPGLVRVHSAGTDPGTALNPLSVQVLEEVGATVDGEYPKPLDPAIAAHAEVVVVLGTEAELDLPPGPRLLRWDTDEPSARGIDGIERMRLIRKDIAARVHALLTELDIPTTGKGDRPVTTGKPSVLFVCIYNAGRSQMAAAFLTHLAADAVEVSSAGSDPADRVNPAAIEAMAELGIDLTGRTPAKLTYATVEAADVVITMGCGDACPVLPGTTYRDWKLDDPAGKGLEAVRPIRDQIHRRVEELIAELLPTRACTTASPARGRRRPPHTGIGALSAAQAASPSTAERCQH
ncbi:low molecular weight phosphatase family protein [Nocardia asteroides]|nr:low molecular weight phosphatase family protein [Nocardia asteroides]UGT62184.1 low molecular weight phosphatase family protein [Nocardia asteroides]